MKILTITLICLWISTNIFTQDKRYTHDSENGYMWQDFEKRMVAKNIKYEFLSSMLENEKLKKLSGNNKDELGCEKEIHFLQSSNKQIDLNEVIDLINQFYLDETNLIIPIRYAYCYSIKTLAGKNKSEMNSYKEKLTEFSKSDLKK